MIILDVMMPEMDGIEACEIIRNDSEIGNSLIVFLSARGEDYSQIAGFNAGADDYITKPFGNAELIARINALLRRTKPRVAEDKITYEDIMICLLYTSPSPRD